MLRLREYRQELRLRFCVARAKPTSLLLGKRAALRMGSRRRAHQHWGVGGVSALGSDLPFRGPDGGRAGHQGQLTTRGHLTKSGQTCRVGAEFYRRFWRCCGHPRAIHGRSSTRGRRLEDGYASNGSSNGSGPRNSTRTEQHDRLFGLRWKEAPLLQPRVQG